MELFRALAAFAEPPAGPHARLASLLGLPAAPSSAEYAEVFLFNLYPYASVYLGDEGMIGGEAQDRAAGVWRVLKRTPPPEPDHLTVLLALYASIVDAEQSESDPALRALARQTRKAYLWEHLTCWIFPYLDKLDQIAPPVYRAWGEMLRAALAAEIDALGPADALPLHLREAAPLPSPADEGLDAFVHATLAPIRSGMVVTRADLARAATRLTLGLRLGERRFILKALIGQDGPAVLGWLAQEARAWIARHERSVRMLGAVGRFWLSRADAAASLYDDLAAQARAGAGWSAPGASL